MKDRQKENIDFLYIYYQSEGIVYNLTKKQHLDMQEQLFAHFLWLNILAILLSTHTKHQNVLCNFDI